MDLDVGKPRLAISFSGGRSSAVMLNRCLERFSNSHEILITFANTGCEDERTLEFVDAVDRNFAGGRVVWIEAEIHERGKGVTAKVVNFETAARKGEPFEAFIAKHGVPCKTHPQCTSRLKEEPMLSYRRQYGWEPGSYETAIGIRADEVDRISSKWKEKRFVYPLIKEGWTKTSVNRFMAQYDWDLKLPNDAWGNCVWCWKKSFRKLMTVARRDPQAFEFPQRMEAVHGMVHNSKVPPDKPRRFFRENTSTETLLAMSQTAEFKEYEDDILEPVLFEWWWDLGGGCGDSCEVGADEMQGISEDAA